MSWKLKLKKKNKGKETKIQSGSGQPLLLYFYSPSHLGFIYFVLKDFVTEINSLLHRRRSIQHISSFVWDGEPHLWLKLRRKEDSEKRVLFDIKCSASARTQINLFHNVLSFVFFSSLFCWLLIGFFPLVIDFRKLENELLRVDLAGCYCFILSIIEKNNDCHQRQTIVNFSNTSKACQSIYFTDRISRPLAQQQRVSRVISSIKIKKEFLIPFLLWAFWEHKQQQRVDMSQWASDI